MKIFSPTIKKEIRYSMLLALAIFLFNISNAQISIGLNGGIGYSSLTYDNRGTNFFDFGEITEKSPWKAGFHSGIYINFPLPFLGKSKLHFEAILNQSINSHRIEYTESGQFDRYTLSFNGGGVEIPYTLAGRILEFDLSSSYISLSSNYRYFLTSSIILNLGLSYNFDINSKGKGNITYVAVQEEPITVFAPNTIPPHPSILFSDNELDIKLHESNIGLNMGVLLRIKSGQKIEVRYSVRVYNFDAFNYQMTSFFPELDHQFTDNFNIQLRSIDRLSLLFEF